jgi:hypothetical protein
MYALLRLFSMGWLLIAALCFSSSLARELPIIEVRWPAAAELQTPVSGRLLIMFGPSEIDADDDLRRRLTPTSEAIAFFGQDISNWPAGTVQRLSSFDAGFPYPTLAQLPRGSYRVQASFEPYQAYRRSDGYQLLLPAIEPLDATDTRTSTQIHRRWRSAAELVHWDGQQTPRPLVLNTALGQSVTQQDTPWVRSLKIRSERLSEFWGRDVFLGALITLPKGYHERPHQRFPLIVRLADLPRQPPDWRERPPDDRFAEGSAQRRDQQAAWENFQYWQADGTPRMLIADLQHPTPYGESSMIVNSLNTGPYADAIRAELIPAIEREFRVIEGKWARFIFGSREGGRSALAWQIHHPQDFNGVLAVCPDSIDFRHFGSVNLQQDNNALFTHGPHLQVPRPAQRTASGQTTALLSDVMRWERALAGRSRSQEFWDRSEAAFSPPDHEGYPQRIWQRPSGVIDDEVAEHWYQAHDLLGLLQRQTPSALSQLRGKLSIRIGDRDEYFMDNAVRSFETSIRHMHPDLELSVDYALGESGCWAGPHDRPANDARSSSLQDLLSWARDRLLRYAPEGSSSPAWRDRHGR